MSLFPETIALALSGGRVDCAFLIRCDFASSTMRLWKGGHTLKTNDGHSWVNLGRLGTVSGLEQAINGDAPAANFTLSANDDEIIAKTKEEFDSEVRGRIVRAFVQFFGDDDPLDPDNQRPLDLPYPVWAGRFLQPSFAFDEGGSRAVSVSAESIFALRSRPRHAMYTDRDQEARYAGDRGFEFVGSLVNKLTTWPDY